MLAGHGAPDLPDGEGLLAVQLLEHAGGLLLGEAPGSRSEFARLRRHSPELADEFVRLRNLLDVMDAAPADPGRLLTMTASGKAR